MSIRQRVKYEVTIYPGGAWHVDRVVFHGGRCDISSLAQGRDTELDSAKAQVARAIQADKDERRRNEEYSAAVEHYTVLG